MTTTTESASPVGPGGLEPIEPRTRWSRLRDSQSAWLLAVLALLLIFFSAMRPDAYPSVANARNITTDAAVLLVLSVGSTFVILTAGIDLSISGVLVFSGVISAKAMMAVGGEGAVTLAAGALAAFASGLLWGLVNGVLVSRARIPPLIVTLGTTGMSLGAALLLTGGVDIADIPMRLVLTLGSGRVAGVPWLVVVAALTALLGGLLLGTTRFGRYTYAVGSNAEACRRAGVDVTRHLVKVYALAGALNGVGAFLSLARFATTTLSGQTTTSLQTIAAVVIGGTSLFGGSGGVLGTVIGVFIPVVLLNGFVILGLQPFWQQVAVGAVLIAAVYVDQVRRRRRER